ncbi:3-keto-disaccharide hydrolase [Planctomicrobium sp. SH664]|uniref:3-keto-disaccharide hydrolase n=1 Tax=Planctomicrobium sp. SH664 TaxID=3448125 RepID=UPI003F5CB569
MQRPLICLGLAIMLGVSGCKRPIASEEKTAHSEQQQPAAGTPDNAPEAQKEATPVANKEASAATKEKSSATGPVIDPPGTPANPADRFLSKAEQAEGWICLFDGSSLFGWTPDKKDVNWSVEDGVLKADTGSNGLLLTDVPFSDFELVCEYRMAAGGNSGVFLRSIPDPVEIPPDCYEVNIADTQPNGYLTCSLVNQAKTESPILGSGDWHTIRVVADGPHIVVDFDGKQVLDYTDPAPNAPKTGKIGLQKNSGLIEFRKVVLKPKGLNPLLSGESLEGWRIVPGGKGEVKNANGAVRMTGGPVFLETEAVFQDFILQGQAQTHAANVNSGYFFRAMPGTEKAPSNGYEMQIDNSIKDGNRNVPANAGTGAIFRRVEARRVVTNDLEWVTTTLIAAGPRMMAWVDGYPVVDWEDTRAADENPRKGLRLDAGHISLQGHDPTSDISFRELKILELPDRVAP